MSSDLHFETLMKTVSAELVETARSVIEDDPKAAAAFVPGAARELANRYSTNQKLVLLATVEGIGEQEMDWHLSAGPTVGSAVNNIFVNCVRERLSKLDQALRVAAFTVGFMPAADSLISLAETATHSEDWLPGPSVAQARAAHDACSSGEGTFADLHTLLQSARLFNRMAASIERDRLFGEHGVSGSAVEAAANEMKFYRDLLMPGWPLLNEAFEQLGERMRNQAGSHKVNGAPAPAVV